MLNPRHPPVAPRIRRRLLFGALAIALGILATQVSAAWSTDRRLRAYATLVLADEARDQGEWESAQASYDQALSLYRELAEEDPKWQPEIVSYRIRYCAEQLERLAPRLAGQEAPAPLTPEVEPAEEAARVYAEQAHALAGENEYLRRRIQGLEEELDRLAGPEEPGAGAEDETAELRDELREAEAELGGLRVEFAAYQAEMQASVSNLQATLATLRLENEETLQANIDLIRQLEAAAEEHLRMSAVLEAAGLEAPAVREIAEEEAPEIETEVPEPPADPEPGPAQDTEDEAAPNVGAEDDMPGSRGEEIVNDLLKAVPF